MADDWHALIKRNQIAILIYATMLLQETFNTENSLQ